MADKPNGGSLFKNDKRGNENWPDYKGSCNIDGKDYWISAWIKTAGPNSKSPGSKFFSFAFKAKDQKPADATQETPHSDAPQTPDEDVPF